MREIERTHVWSRSQSNEMTRPVDGVRTEYRRAHAAVILDHRLVGERYFFPRADALIVTTVGVALACHLDDPHPDAPMLLHFHGNGEVVADHKDGLAAELVRLRLHAGE